MSIASRFDTWLDFWLYLCTELAFLCMLPTRLCATLDCLQLPPYSLACLLLACSIVANLLLCRSRDFDDF